MYVALGDRAESVVPPIVTSLLDRDRAGWRELSVQVDPDALFTLVAAAFTGAVFRRWPDDPTQREIVEFAHHHASAPDEAVIVTATVIEAAIRSAFGEALMLRGLNPLEVLAAYAMVIHAIQDEGYLPSSERADYIAEVVDAVT